MNLNLNTNNEVYVSNGTLMRLALTAIIVIVVYFLLKNAFAK